MLYNSVGIMILEVLLYLLTYTCVISLIIFFIMISCIKLLKNKKSDNSDNKDNKMIICSLLFSIIFSIFLSNNICFLFNKETTTINSHKDSDLKSIINQIVDFKNKETEIIYVSSRDIKIDHEEKKDYLDISAGKYIIPLADMSSWIQIKKLLFSEEYEEQENSLNKIEVYKNTKYLKSVNGININDYSKIKNFTKEK